MSNFNKLFEISQNSKLTPEDLKLLFINSGIELNKNTNNSIKLNIEMNPDLGYIIYDHENGGLSGHCKEEDKDKFKTFFDIVEKHLGKEIDNREAMFNPDKNMILFGKTRTNMIIDELIHSIEGRTFPSDFDTKKEPFIVNDINTIHKISIKTDEGKDFVNFSIRFPKERNFKPEIEMAFAKEFGGKVERFKVDEEIMKASINNQTPLTNINEKINFLLKNRINSYEKNEKKLNLNRPNEKEKFSCTNKYIENVGRTIQNGFNIIDDIKNNTNNFLKSISDFTKETVSFYDDTTQNDNFFTSFLRQGVEVLGPDTRNHFKQGFRDGFQLAIDNQKAIQEIAKVNKILNGKVLDEKLDMILMERRGNRDLIYQNATEYQKIGISLGKNIGELNLLLNKAKSYIKNGIDDINSKYIESISNNINSKIKKVKNLYNDYIEAGKKLFESFKDNINKFKEDIEKKSMEKKELKETKEPLFKALNNVLISLKNKTDKFFEKNEKDVDNFMKNAKVLTNGKKYTKEFLAEIIHNNSIKIELNKNSDNLFKDLIQARPTWQEQNALILNTAKALKNTNLNNLEGNLQLINEGQKALKQKEKDLFAGDFIGRKMVELLDQKISTKDAIDQLANTYYLIELRNMIVDEKIKPEEVDNLTFDKLNPEKQDEYKELMKMVVLDVPVMLEHLKNCELEIKKDEINKATSVVGEEIL